MRLVQKYSDRTWYNIITLLSLVVVAVVALLLWKAQGTKSASPEIYMLPKLNAILNGSVAVLLTTGFFFIRRKNIMAHRACMIAAFIFSIVFLVSYITYHYGAPETRFGDLDHNGEISAAEKLQAGGMRLVYFIILITHIVLAALIVPMALLTLYRIWRNDIARHRRIARWTFPIWLYVSITGVVVYLMISPYYPF